MTTVLPAYGRDYKTARAAKHDWALGKDFIIADFFSPDDGRYINMQDAEDAGLSITIRFCQKTKIVKVTK